MSAPCPLISVLMPARNAEKTIGRALASLTAQHYSHLEILVGDDGSEDETVREALAAAAADGRIRVLPKTRAGMVETLNRLFSRARGSWIARMDADDIAHPVRFSRQIDLARRRSANVIGCCLRMFPTQKVTPAMRAWLHWQNSLLEHHAILRERYVETTISHATLLLEREVLERVGGWRVFDGPEDLDLLLRLAEDGARFAKAAGTYYFWRCHGAMSTRRDRRYRREAFLDLKAAALAAGPLRRSGQVQVWGTGRSLQAWIDALSRHGVHASARPLAVRSMRGPNGAISAGALPDRPEGLVLLAFGVAKIRVALRAALVASGATEGEDYLFCA